MKQQKYVKHAPQITFTHTSNEIFRSLNALHQVAKSALGPLGASQMLKLGTGGFANVLVTCNSQAFLNNVQTHTALARILTQTATNKHILCYDGSWQFLYLCVEFINVCREWPQHWIDDLLSWIEQHVELFFASPQLDQRIRINVLKDVELIVALVCSILTSSSLLAELTDEHRIHIAMQIVRAFFDALPDNLPQAPQRPPITVLTVESLPYQDTYYLKGLLLSIPIPFELELLYAPPFYSTNGEFSLLDAPIIIYKLPLQFENITQGYDHLDSLNEHSEAVKMHFEFHHPQGEQSGDALEHIAIKLYGELFEKYIQLGVKIVASQKTIHPFVKSELVKRGVVPLERLSLLHVESVRQMTGAQILGEISPMISAHSVGRVHKLRRVQINEQSYLHICEPPMVQPTADVPKVRTIILGAQSPFIAAELKLLCEKSVDILHQMLYYPYVVLGGSNIELRLFEYLQERITHEIATSLQDGDASVRAAFGVRLNSRELSSPSVSNTKLERCARALVQVFRRYSVCLLQDESRTEHILHDLNETYDLLLGEYCDTVFDFWISKKRTIQESLRMSSLLGSIGGVIEQSSE